MMSMSYFNNEFNHNDNCWYYFIYRTIDYTIGFYCSFVINWIACAAGCAVNE